MSDRELRCIRADSHNVRSRGRTWLRSYRRSGGCSSRRSDRRDIDAGTENRSSPVDTDTRQSPGHSWQCARYTDTSPYTGRRTCLHDNLHTDIHYIRRPHRDCASGCVVECRTRNREVAGSNLGRGYFAPTSTQPSILRGRYTSTSCGWEGKGRYGSFRLWIKRRVCR